MNIRTLGILFGVLGLSMGLGCGSKGGSDGPAAHLNRAQAKALFPSVLGSFAQGGFKVQPGDAECVQYKSDYLRGQKSVKVVVNDCLPKGDPAWDDLMSEGDSEIAGMPSAVEKDGRTTTVMIRVGRRFRVDFKSRDMDEAALQDAAETFNWSRLKSLAGL